MGLVGVAEALRTLSDFCIKNLQILSQCESINLETHVQLVSDNGSTKADQVEEFGPDIGQV